MSGLTRFGVSIPEELLEAFDRHLEETRYANRSEAIRDLIRERLDDLSWEEDGDVAGTIVYVYDHHRKDLSERLTRIQHDALDIIVSNLHVHLDHQNCLEVVVVRGASGRVKALADEMRRLKGVYRCAVARAGLGRRFGHSHPHG